MRRGELIKFVGVVEQQQWRNESWTERGDKSVLASDFDGWVPAITEVIQAVGDCYRWALFDRDPLQK